MHDAGQALKAKPHPFDQPVYVTRPLLPPLRSYVATLEQIWKRQRLTNGGPVQDAFEQALCNYLRVTHLSLTNNGTTALILTLRAMGIKGEVITTPLTSPATVNAVLACGLTPVFADIDATNLTLDPDKVERALTPRTGAILPVHLYGMPCAVEALQAIASRQGLPLIFDGAHAFGIETKGKSLLAFGDATIASFHATKLFNTAEGGAVVVRDRTLKERIDLFKNLGIADASNIVQPGINGRMNELAAALGLTNLDVVEDEFRKRAEIAMFYRERLAGIGGLTCLEFPPDVRDRLHYFVVRVGAGARLSRDELLRRLETFNVLARRYFYPLCSNLPYCQELASSDPAGLPVANRAANEVLCLPFYGDLGLEAAGRIGDIVAYLMT